MQEMPALSHRQGQELPKEPSVVQHYTSLYYTSSRRVSLCISQILVNDRLLVSAA